MRTRYELAVSVFQNPTSCAALTFTFFHPRLTRLGTGLKVYSEDKRSPCFISLSLSLSSLHFLGSPARLPFPLSIMQTCSGSSKDPGAPCTCTSFVPKPPPKENKCNVCRHRRSAHTDSAPNANSKYVKRLLKNITATAVHDEARKEMVQGFRPRQPSSAVTTPPVSILLCTDPSLYSFICGLRSQSPKGKGKGKAIRRTSTRVTSGQSSPGSGNVKIGRIVIFPCGTEVSIACQRSAIFNHRTWFSFPESEQISISCHQLPIAGLMGFSRACN